MLIDPLTGAATVVVGARQGAPTFPRMPARSAWAGSNRLSRTRCAAFVNRWPALPDDRCEVVLYTSRHDATFASLGVEGARRVVDLWADRSAALGARGDVAYVLVFENRGAEVGATIAHPHGQIYAFDLVPPAAARRATSSPTALPRGRTAMSPRRGDGVRGRRVRRRGRSTSASRRRAESPTCRR